MVNLLFLFPKFIYLLGNVFNLVLLIDLIERRFPQQLGNFIYDISYYSLNLYSRCQILFDKILAKSKYFTKNINKINFIKKIDLPQGYGHKYINIFEFDKKRKIIYHSDNYFSNNLTENDFVKSSVKFILIYFHLNTNKTSYNLEINLDEYYLIGNKFNKIFLLNHIKLPNIKDINECYLNMIDHEANTKIVKFTDKNEYVELFQDTYEILNEKDIN